MICITMHADFSKDKNLLYRILHDVSLITKLVSQLVSFDCSLQAYCSAPDLLSDVGVIQAISFLPMFLVGRYYICGRRKLGLHYKPPMLYLKLQNHRKTSLFAVYIIRSKPLSMTIKSSIQSITSLTKVILRVIWTMLTSGHLNNIITFTI